MTVFLEHLLNTKAVYWEPLGTDGSGRTTWKDPVEINCRWESVAEIVRNDDGSMLQITTKVFPNRELKVGGRLLKGSLTEDLTSQPPLNATQEIQTFEAAESLSGSQVSYTARL